VFGKRIQVLLRDAIDTEWGANPEVAVGVLENCDGIVGIQPVFGLDPAKVARGNPKHSVCGCTYPNHVISVAVDRTDPPLRKLAARSKAGEGAVPVLAQPGISADPQRAAFVLIERAHVTSYAAVGLIEQL
jgi:hypothetical protein